MPSWSAKARRTTSGSSSVGLYYRGQRRTDLEREYLDVYHPINEGIPRLRQLPDGHLVPIKDLYTAEELKTSRAYNEALLRGQYQQGVNVLLAGPGGSRMTWSLADPVVSEGWGSSQIAMVRRLTPHIRQFIRVRQALVRAKAGDTTVTALLENPRIGVLHLDRRGRILAANDRARSLLRQGEELSDEAGVLQARAPDDQGRLARLVAEALPTSGAVPVSGSMQLGRVSGSQRRVYPAPGCIAATRHSCAPARARAARSPPARSYPAPAPVGLGRSPLFFATHRASPRCPARTRPAASLAAYSRQSAPSGVSRPRRSSRRTYSARGSNWPPRTRAGGTGPSPAGPLRTPAGTR